MEEETLRNVAVNQSLKGKDRVAIYRGMGDDSRNGPSSASVDIVLVQLVSRPIQSSSQSHPCRISPEMRKFIVNVPEPNPGEISVLKLVPLRLNGNSEGLG